VDSSLSHHWNDDSDITTAGKRLHNQTAFT
jgi:hypothetical protein